MVSPGWMATAGLAAATTLCCASVGRSDFDAGRMAWADRAIQEAIDRGRLPGAVLLVGRGDQVVYRKAYGHRAIEPQRVPMTEDTIFDLASVSKVVGCATAVMILVERGRLNLTDKVAGHLPAFGAHGKDAITVEQLLLHRGGLVPDNPLSDYGDGPEKAWERIFDLRCVYEPGTEFRYSDVGYIVLGRLVEVVDGRPLDRFAREEIFEPLGMVNTAYLPPEEWKPRIAPTERRDGRWMVGQVHDPRAWALGGVAGHAGLFGTADDLARWCRMVLRGGELDGRRVLSGLTVREMTRGRCLEDGGGCRGYGFDVSTGYSSARGNLFEAGSTFGHTGFTGTMFWIDPHHDAYVILLSNSVHPDGKGSVIDLRRRVATVAASAIVERPDERCPPQSVRAPRPAGVGRRAATGRPAEVLCGIDVLKRENFRRLAGRRVAVLTNHTGRDADGRRLVDLLLEVPEVKVVHLLSPEHGLYGTLDEKVGDTVDEATGLKVFSLYGQTRRPTPEMLAGIDTIVYDIQDIGARFYTYVATMVYAMEEAARAGIRMVVLDRPNPITGLRPDGPIADESKYGFTACGPLPVVHAMTLGELAMMFNAEHRIGCDLQVVKMEGWRREMWWDQTGLTWVNPSPNMRNLTQATLYPAVCLLEACNLSVGRGTDQPFELFGAPWIDGRRLAAELNAAELPGLRFVPVTFTPAAGSKLGGQTCGGVYVLVTDRDALAPVRSGLTMAWCLRKLFGEAFEIDKVDNLLANAEVMRALKETDDPARLPELWREPLAKFDLRRRPYLLYP